MCDSRAGRSVHLHMIKLNNLPSLSCSRNISFLFIEGDLYSAAPLDTDGSSLQFRRKAGSRTNVWMYDNWVSGGFRNIVD